MKKQIFPSLRFAPLDSGSWDGLVALFGARGACGGCWCMAWRLSRKQWESQKGAGNRRALRRIVGRGTVRLAFGPSRG